MIVLPIGAAVAIIFSGLVLLFTGRSPGVGAAFVVLGIGSLVFIWSLEASDGSDHE